MMASPRLVSLALACAATAAFAQSEIAVPGSIPAGERIAASGAGERVPACRSCHGERGEGDARLRVPRLAGQPARYLVRQLDSYADGRRRGATMVPIANALTPAQRRDVAAWYASVVPVAAPDAPPAPRDLARARTLATVGDRARRIQGCAACHGSGGRGEPPAYPYLAGQHAGYLADALRAWRDGARDNDPSGQMPTIAKALADEDVALLADYFASLPPQGRIDRRDVPPDAVGGR